MAANSLGIDKQVHELKLGQSFDPKSKVAFHSIRYDFKPASVDTSREARVEVGDGNQVTVTVPHVQSSGTTHTVYKGNKRPCLKECVLVIDHRTGMFTLEKLSNTITLKKTRIEGSSKAQQGGRPLTPVDMSKQKVTSPPKNKGKEQRSPASLKGSPSMASSYIEPDKNADSPIGHISDSSSDNSSDSDSDSEASVTQQSPALSSNTHNMGILTSDLQLSESGSDSD